MHKIKKSPKVLAVFIFSGIDGQAFPDCAPKKLKRCSQKCPKVAKMLLKSRSKIIGSGLPAMLCHLLIFLLVLPLQTLEWIIFLVSFLSAVIRSIPFKYFFEFTCLDCALLAGRLFHDKHIILQLNRPRRLSKCCPGNSF